MAKYLTFLVLLVAIFYGCASLRQSLEEEQKPTNVEFQEEKNKKVLEKNVGQSPSTATKYRYVYKLVAPVERDSLFFSDMNISAEFVLDESFVHVRLRNRMKEKINVSLKDAKILIDGRSSDVLNFSYLNEFYYSPINNQSSVEIIPNAFVIFHLAPSENVIFSDSRYEVVGLYPYLDFSNGRRVSEFYENIGKKITLYLPVETASEVLDYRFEFRITDVREDGPYNPTRRRSPLVVQQQQFPSEIIIKGEGLNPAESFIASTLISFFVLISAYFIFAKEKGKI